MDFSASFVHPFRTPEKYYLYDVNTNCILDINEDLYLFFLKKIHTLPEKSIHLAQELFSNGYLKQNPIDKIEHSATKYLDTFLNTAVQNITLQVTQQCNLRCKYCIYSGTYLTRTHANKTMPWNIAKKSIDFLLKKSADTDTPTIGFYGGEPLLNFPLIKKSVEYAKSQFEGKEIQFGITTNATLLDRENIDFFDKNKFHILISLDGPKQVHDSNRIFASTGKGTFDVVMDKIKYIKDNYLDLYKKTMFNAVVDPKLGTACINNFFLSCDEISADRINITYLSKNFLNADVKATYDTSENFWISLRKQEFKVFMAKLGRISKEHFTGAHWLAFEQFKSVIHSTRGFSRELPRTFHPSGPCLPGVRKLFVDVGGRFYPCERVSESSYMTIGHIDNGFDIDKIYNILNIGKLTESNCKNCWAARFCLQCCSAADDGVGLSAETRLSNCNISINNAESMLKNYCVLREYDFSFENDGLEL